MHSYKRFRILVEGWGEGVGSPESRVIAVIGTENRRTLPLINADNTDQKPDIGERKVESGDELRHSLTLTQYALYP
jgi:hypothetical protein